MYEATGIGTLLLTDNKKNLSEIFIPGIEVIAYDSVADAIEKANYYLQNEEERIIIAKKGQQRTHENYNYIKTVSRMIEYFKAIL